MADMVTLMSTKIKTYSELIKLPTFRERFEYLQLNGAVGASTFGHDRYLNQILYHTYEWLRFRREIIIRDNGCDLGCAEYEIAGRVLVHHINPITVEDILNRSSNLFDPDNVICTSHDTHNAIHYGDINLLGIEPVERTQYDTCPWRV